MCDVWEAKNTQHLSPVPRRFQKDPDFPLRKTRRHQEERDKEGLTYQAIRSSDLVIFAFIIFADCMFARKEREVYGRKL